jgi:hypothetical protein
MMFYSTISDLIYINSSCAARDSRRAYLPGGTKKMEKLQVKPTAKEGEEGAVESPLTPGKPFKYKTQLRDILDNEHNGYTI